MKLANKWDKDLTQANSTKNLIFEAQNNLQVLRQLRAQQKEQENI